MPRLTADTVTAFRPLAQLIPPHWATASMTAADGTALHWRETSAAGLPVVLLHGIQVDGGTWMRTAQALEARHRIVMPDFRGHGASGPLGEGASLQTFVDDIRAIIDTLALDRPVVIGHSMGAEVAGRLAGVTDLRGVVLVDPPLGNVVALASIDIDAPPPWLQPVFDALRALRDQPHAERMVTGLGLLPPGSATEWDERDYVSFVEGQARFDLDVYRHLRHVPPLVDVPDAVAAITCPALLLTAQPMLPGVDLQAAVAAFTRQWRQGRHVHVPDSGHAIHVERFDTFIDAIADFIDEVTDTGR
jgi:pimeloyl-ACP methyl ester carboxylesterase